MTSDPETVLWTMLTGVDAARDHVRRAAAESGFRPSSGDEDRINIDVPFSLRKRRRAARFTGAASPSPRGAIIAWTADPEPLNHEHLASIEEKLPEGVMHYHGLEDAALRAGLSMGGRTTLRVIVRALARDETVRGIGKGHLNETAAYVVLTTKRLLVIEASGLGSKTLVDATCESIEAPSLGKRTTGETLRIVLPQGPIVISRLGHGEGHGIVKSYRDDQKERARVVPRPATDCKQPLESENLDSR
ncbi:MAG: hypothetical protein JWN19_294 [Arthrobacter sp.]|jgi:hypothetical protein|nr:hypothetical protein [Arthrobacter sp.]